MMMEKISNDHPNLEVRITNLRETLHFKYLGFTVENEAEEVMREILTGNTAYLSLLKNHLVKRMLKRHLYKTLP